jgi:hypothetical protein
MGGQGRVQKLAGTGNISEKAKSLAICCGKSLLKRSAAFRFFGFRGLHATLLRKIA